MILTAEVPFPLGSRTVRVALLRQLATNFVALAPLRSLPELLASAVDYRPYGRRSVDRFVLVSGFPLVRMT
jgi:hypothetical protein